MIKDGVKEAFDLFLPEVEYKHCCLLDSLTNRYDIYYIPVLEVMEIQEGKKRENHIFRVAGTKEIEVVASLEVVEAVLRRKASGIRITFLSEV